MLLLIATTDKLQLVTGSAGTINVHASWMDFAASAVTPGKTNTSITTATTTDILAAPAASTQRNAKTLNIRNAHASNSNAVTILYNENGTTYELFKCTLAAQEVLSYVEGFPWDIYAADGSHKAQSARMLFKNLSADDTGGTNVATAQPWFPTAGAVSVDALTSYFFEGYLFTTRTAGAVSHTTGVLFGGTATLTNIDYWGEAKVGDTNALAAPNGFWSNAATSLVVKIASTAATENTFIWVEGTVRINAAGTFIPQFIYSVAPGGTPTIKRGTFFRMWPIGDNNVVSQGVWA